MDGKEICDDYSKHFDNFDEVAHPSVWFTPRFDALMLKAIARGSALTQAEVEAEFGFSHESWEW